MQRQHWNQKSVTTMDAINNPRIFEGMDPATARLILKIALREAEEAGNESDIRRLEAVVRTVSRSRGIHNGNGESSATGAHQGRRDSTRHEKGESSAAGAHQGRRDSDRQEKGESSAAGGQREKQSGIHHRHGQSSTTSLHPRRHDSVHQGHGETSVAGAKREKEKNTHRTSDARREEGHGTESFKCVACYDRFGGREVATLKCSHYWCKECLERRFSICKDRSMYPPKCCDVEIPVQPGFMDRACIKKYEERKLEWDTKHPIYCSYTKCAKFIPPPSPPTSSLYVRCPRCQTKTCKRCKKAAHSETVKCKDGGDEALQAAIKLMKENHWQRCPRCHAGIERTAGCNEMTLV